jgi:hypothetical protein
MEAAGDDEQTKTDLRKLLELIDDGARVNTVGAMTNVLAAVEPTANDWKKVGADPIPNLTEFCPTLQEGKLGQFRTSTAEILHLI